MKNVFIIILTIFCFSAFFYLHYSITRYFNPYEINWKQFKPDGTLVYCNSGMSFLTATFLKSLIASIPFAIILIVKLKQTPHHFLPILKYTTILNGFVLLMGLIFTFIGILVGNLYHSHTASKTKTLIDHQAITASTFAHYFMLTSLAVTFTTVIISQKKTLQKLAKM